MSTPRTLGSEMALGPVARELPTARELQVLQLICDGCATKEIAARLGISFKTAVCHRYRLMEKAGRTQLHRPFPLGYQKWVCVPMN
jgi:DNA-binding NarL/FixJ family response regulator